MKRSVIIGLVVIAAAIVIAPIVYVVANYYLPSTLTQISAQPNIQIAYQGSSGNLTVTEYWTSSFDVVHRYELWGANTIVTLSNTGDVNGYCKVAYYLLGVEQCVHTIFVKAHGGAMDSAKMYYPTAPIILTQSSLQAYYTQTYDDAEAKIISQWKA
jgi:hypothetical protein